MEDSRIWHRGLKSAASGVPATQPTTGKQAESMTCIFWLSKEVFLRYSAVTSTSIWEIASGTGNNSRRYGGSG